MATYTMGLTISPMTIAAQGSTNPAAGVMATSPATRPVAAPTSVHFPTVMRSVSIQESTPAALAATVFSSASPATPSAANSLPALNPNQPNHRSAAPRATNGTLWGR